jgi:hypothetical protein
LLQWQNIPHGSPPHDVVAAQHQHQDAFAAFAAADFEEEEEQDEIRRNCYE